MTAAGAATDLPKVVLVGDSIRLGYAPLVVERLAGKATVASAAENGGDSANVLAHLDDWVIRGRPDVVHLNCGLHGLKVSRQDGRHQIPLEQYEANLREIVARLRRDTSAALVFATTTPILDDRHAARGASFDRYAADVVRYNETALAVMRAAGVPVHDLYGIVEQAGSAAHLVQDGTHYTPEGYARLADAVADTVLRQLIVRRYPHSPASPGWSQPPPSAQPAGAGASPLLAGEAGEGARAGGEEGRRGPAPGGVRSAHYAAETYRRTEAERDAAVSPRYRDISVPELPIPAGRAAWDAQRPHVLETVVRSLGDLPPRPSPPRVRLVSRELRSGYTLERVALDNGVDGEVSALLLVPEGLRRPAPAILWLHSSTPDKTQTVVPGTNGGAESLGEVFVRAGYVVLSPDAYGHGDRAGTGPAGPLETLRDEQLSLFKFHLWFGRTLWGMFVRDDQVALDYLCSRPEVDATRIGATGMSMGSTRAWWLAAVDERIAATVGVACLTRYQELIRHGQLRQHGIYYWVNGLLNHFDTEGVLSLIAPRPFLALTGDLDAGSPADGIRVLEEKVGAVYAALGAADRFQSVLYPDVGHTYTPEMRAAMLTWFRRWLQPQPAGGTLPS